MNDVPNRIYGIRLYRTLTIGIGIESSISGLDIFTRYFPRVMCIAVDASDEPGIDDTLLVDGHGHSVKTFAS